MRLLIVFVMLVACTAAINLGGSKPVYIVQQDQGSVSSQYNISIERTKPAPAHWSMRFDFDSTNIAAPPSEAFIYLDFNNGTVLLGEISQEIIVPSAGVMLIPVSFEPASPFDLPVVVDVGITIPELSSEPYTASVESQYGASSNLLQVMPTALEVPAG